MSFQNFVAKFLDNSVDENTAYKKYQDFLANLSQSKVERFFEANKDREWFRLKYHPFESQRSLHQQNSCLMKRLKIFNDLNDIEYFTSVPFTARNTTLIINLMNAIIVQLEDGPQDLSDKLLQSDTSNIDLALIEKYVPTNPTSIVIDDINIETTLSELEEFCKSAHSDVLRLAQLEPYYIEEGHMRKKVIAVYANHVDIRDVCWKLSRSKLNNRSLIVSINKPIVNRVVPVDVLSNHHISIVNDIRYATILILNFDELKGLYGKRKQLLETMKHEINSLKTAIKHEDGEQMQVDDESKDINGVAPPSPPGSDKSGGEASRGNEDKDERPFDVSSLDEEKEKDKKKLFEFKFNTEPSHHRLATKLSKSKNPLLEGAYLYFVDHISSTQARYDLARIREDLRTAEIKEFLGQDEQDKLAILETTIRNLPRTVEESARFLDKLLWYLRIVHSFDYYNKSIYRQEDDLTLRMGVVHVRQDPNKLSADVDLSTIREYIQKVDKEYERFGASQTQKFVTKDEERYYYRSYGKVITDELESYSQRVQKARSNETEEVYKCRHCTRVFQKLGDIGRHLVTKHRWAIDAIELETDFFNAYLFDTTKMDPCPPKELVEIRPNRFVNLTNLNQKSEEPDPLQQTKEAYKNLEPSVLKEAPRTQVEGDPRNESIVDYTDISFDDAI